MKINVKQASVPTGEDFEHNDLEGNYIGDTSSHSIQTNTVIENSYSLKRSGSGNWRAIVRDSTTKFTFDGLRINFRQTPLNNNGGTTGGVAVGTSKSGYSNGNFYSGYMQPNNDHIRLYRHNSGSPNEIANREPISLSYGTEYTGYLEFNGDTITYSVEGTTISGTDTNYDQGYLAIAGFGDFVIDDITFESI